jgi:Holliday junction resolvase RusA-like endonuclease
MHRVNIKPLSVNDCWQGKRFKTPAYGVYERTLMLLLPKLKLPDPPYQLHFKWGFSNVASDIDNPCKPTLDSLSKKYGFNDKLVKKLILESIKVKVGQEYFEFEITTYQPNGEVHS